MAPLDGVLRLEARYEAFGRPATMVFHYRRYDLAPPTYTDCHELAQQYGLWENNGIGNGYALIRSADSLFTAANVQSVDSRSRASFVDTPFSRSGQNPELGSFMIASTMAPLVQWVVGVDRQFHGRTYCVGVAQPAIFVPSDYATVSLVVADDIITQMRLLIPPGPPASRLGMVSLSRARRYSPTGALVALPIVDVAMRSHLMGTQRRRTRHGRG